MSATKVKRQSKAKRIPKANPIATAAILADKPKANGKAKPQVVEHANSTAKRFLLDDFVATGKATIANVLQEFGEGTGGLRTIARHVRFGRYQIPGCKADAQPHLDSDSDKLLAAKLQKLKPNTPIKRLVAPPRRK